MAVIRRPYRVSNRVNGSVLSKNVCWIEICFTASNVTFCGTNTGEQQKANAKKPERQNSKIAAAEGEMDKG
jgi:hypothetical protein